MNIKKYLLSGAVIIIFAIYAIHLRSDNEVAASKVAIKQNSSTPIPNVSQTPGEVVGPTPPASPSPSISGKYKDGVYTGSVADAFYGNIQVQATIKGGKITDVQFLQYPNDRETSIAINSQAMPLLRDEAIQAQSAQVDGVSGATQSSRAFIESLGSALQQAI